MWAFLVIAIDFAKRYELIHVVVLINLVELCSLRFKREVRSRAFEGKHLKCFTSKLLGTK